MTVEAVATTIITSNRCGKAATGFSFLPSSYFFSNNTLSSLSISQTDTGGISLHLLCAQPGGKGLARIVKYASTKGIEISTNCAKVVEISVPLVGAYLMI